MTETNPEQPQGDGSDQSNDSNTPQAPVPAEPKPVQVSPADQSDPNTKSDTILGADYEVTPDRGYRKVQEQQSSSTESSSDDSNSVG